MEFDGDFWGCIRDRDAVARSLVVGAGVYHGDDRDTGVCVGADGAGQASLDRGIPATLSGRVG
jgi:hypothetical protein